MATLQDLKNRQNTPRTASYTPTFLDGLSIGRNPDPNSGARRPTVVLVRSLQTSATRLEIDIRAKWNQTFECGPTFAKIRFSGRVVRDGLFVSGAEDHAIGVFKDEIGMDLIGTEFSDESERLIGPMLSTEMSRGLMEALTAKAEPLPYEKVVEVSPMFVTRFAALIYSQDPDFRRAQPNGFVPRLDEEGLVAPTAFHAEILPCVQQRYTVTALDSIGGRSILTL